MMQSFPKKEHLCGFKAIELLHEKGNAFMAYPFRCVYLVVDNDNENVPVRAMVSVSKKRFKKAVDRNRVKRLMREAYRRNKCSLIVYVSENDLSIHLAMQYVADEMLPYSEMERKMEKALEKLLVKLNEEYKS